MTNSDEIIVAEIYKNFLEALSVISSRLILDTLQNGSFPDEFDKDELLDNISSKWKDEIKQIIQKRVNTIHNQNVKNKDKVTLENILYGSFDVEDIQIRSNNIFKEACKKVDELIATLKLNG